MIEIDMIKAFDSIKMGHIIFAIGLKYFQLGHVILSLSSLIFTSRPQQNSIIANTDIICQRTVPVQTNIGTPVPIKFKKP